MSDRCRLATASAKAVLRALHGDTLVIPWDHEGQSSLIALDATNGEIRWQVERDERTTWATPFIVEHNGRTQVVTNGHRVRSYDLKTGDLVWECGGQVENPIPSPVLQDNMIVCMTGYRGNAIYAIPLDATDDVTDTDVVAWKRDDARRTLRHRCCTRGSSTSQNPVKESCRRSMPPRAKF
ncbi:MAG: PQQ-binding-like beta-propeller repeat protein [Planctomycetaceae bacterium]